MSRIPFISSSAAESTDAASLCRTRDVMSFRFLKLYSQLLLNSGTGMLAYISNLGYTSYAFEMISSPEVEPPCCSIRRCHSTKTFSKSCHCPVRERVAVEASRLAYCFKRDSETVDWLSQ